jgi:hypothetical protein
MVQSRIRQLLRLGAWRTSCGMGVSLSLIELVEAREKLTSDELEGLGDHLLAAVVVLVVGHDYGCVWVVGRAGVAAMAGGSRS